MLVAPLPLEKVFPDYEARLSRYAYLVSLFPEKIKQDLNLSFETEAIQQQLLLHLILR